MARPGRGRRQGRLCQGCGRSPQEPVVGDLWGAAARVSARREGVQDRRPQGRAHVDRRAAVPARALPRRHLVVRESSPERASAPSMETTQRWTFSHLATSIEAAGSGYGFAWLPEEKIRQELAAGRLKPLPMREGGERFADLYLIFADREHAGPATLRLAEIIREAVASECKRSASQPKTSARKRIN